MTLYSLTAYFFMRLRDRITRENAAFISKNFCRILKMIDRFFGKEYTYDYSTETSFRA